MLHANTYLQNSEQLQLLQDTPISEVILEHSQLGRMGQLTTKSLISLAEQAQQQSYRVCLQWDVLGKDEILQQGLRILQQLPLELISAIRVQDVGVAELVTQNFPELPIHLITETGNHNIHALEGWKAYFGKSLERLVLSNELTSLQIQDYCQQLQIPCELLGIGRCLLLYTPRSLLKPVLDRTDEFIEEHVRSTENPHRPFPTIENQHGTFFFHHKDLSLLDVLDKVEDAGVQWVRMDLRHVKHFEVLKNMTSLSDIQEHWPVSTIHGFFRSNRTDRPVKRLKNQHLDGSTDQLVGYVAESAKEQFLAIVNRKSFQLKDTLLFVTPEGKEKQVTVQKITNMEGHSIEHTQASGVWLIPYHKGIPPQTQVYFLSENAS